MLEPGSHEAKKRSFRTQHGGRLRSRRPSTHHLAGSSDTPGMGVRNPVNAATRVLPDDDAVSSTEENDHLPLLRLGASAVASPGPPAAAHTLRSLVRSEVRSFLGELGLSAIPPAAAPANDAESKTLTVDDLATLLGLNRKTVYDLIARGQLPGVRRCGRRIVAHRSTVLDWLRSGQGSVPRSRRIP